MAAPAGYAMPPPPMMAAEPPEVQSIKSMLHIVRILAIIFGILLALGGIAYAVLAILAYDTCTSVAGNICASIGIILVFPIVIIIWGVIDFIIYMQMKEIEAKVDQRQYEAAKSKTLIWMILGFILGGILLGILLLVAYLKFDPLITWQRNQMQGGAPPPGYAPAYAPAAPAPAPMPPPAAPPAPAPVAAPQAPFCAKCGKPTTYIPQYGRYYCYTDNLYV